MRVKYLDNAKGLLILSVVLGHLFQTTFLSQYIYNFHMMAFFIIAGMLFYLTNAERRPFLKFFTKKLLSCAVPFAFFELLALPKVLIAGAGHVNINGFLFNILMLDFNNGDLWFLFVLFWVELLLYAECRILKKDWMSILLVVILFAVSIYFQPSSNILKYICRVFRANILVFAGYYIQKKGGVSLWLSIEKKLHISAADFGIIAFSALLIVTIKFSAIGFTFANVSFRTAFLWLMNSGLGTFLVLALGTLNWSGWLSYLGKNSIIIYGTHHILLSVIGGLLGVANLRETPIGKGIVVFCIVMTIEVAIIYLINRYAPFLVGNIQHKKREQNKKESV